MNWQEVVILNARKGFVKFAIQNGLTLVPMYGFGENEVKKLSNLAD